MGIDDVYCLSVNDAFVMRQWGLHQGLEEEKEDSSNPLNPGNFKRVKLIPDGACLFTRGMGMSCTWSTERGFGERSWRYAMIINDMKVEKLFVEVSRPSMWHFNATTPLPIPRLPVCAFTARIRTELRTRPRKRVHGGARDGVHQICWQVKCSPRGSSAPAALLPVFDGFVSIRILVQRERRALGRSSVCGISSRTVVYVAVGRIKLSPRILRSVNGPFSNERQMHPFVAIFMFTQLNYAGPTAPTRM
jgi:hypothetical protein